MRCGTNCFGGKSRSVVILPQRRAQVNFFSPEANSLSEQHSFFICQPTCTEVAMKAAISRHYSMTRHNRGVWIMSHQAAYRACGFWFTSHPSQLAISSHFPLRNLFG